MLDDQPFRPGVGSQEKVPVRPSRHDPWRRHVQYNVNLRSAQAPERVTNSEWYPRGLWRGVGLSCLSAGRIRRRACVKNTLARADAATPFAARLSPEGPQCFVS